MPDIDTLKSILRMFTYGLFVAASAGPEGPCAATISWVTQVSFEPKLVAVAMRKGTAICEAVQASRHFALHVVGVQQPELARAFFKSGPAGPQEIGGYHYELNARGVPILDAATAWVVCEVIEEANQSGDHAVFVAAVSDGKVQAPGIGPLALKDTVWHYGG